MGRPWALGMLWIFLAGPVAARLICPAGVVFALHEASYTAPCGDWTSDWQLPQISANLCPRTVFCFWGWQRLSPTGDVGSNADESTLLVLCHLQFDCWVHSIPLPSPAAECLSASSSWSAAAFLLWWQLGCWRRRRRLRCRWWSHWCHSRRWMSFFSNFDLSKTWLRSCCHPRHLLCEHGVLLHWRLRHCRFFLILLLLAVFSPRLAAFWPGLAGRLRCNPSSAPVSLTLHTV